MSMKKIFIFFALLIYLAGAAQASYISLQTSVSTRLARNTLYVTVSAVNKGDEKAYNLQAEIKVGDQKVLAEKWDELGIDETYRETATFRLNFEKPGEYPLFVTVHYADANLYPFSALTCQTFLSGAESLPSEIFGKVWSSPFFKKGKAKVTLKNLSDAEISVLTSLFVPRELTAQGTPRKISLAPKAEKAIDFAIENFSALSGSSYQVFAVSVYEREGRHFSSIIPGTIKIEETKNVLGMNYVPVVLILIILIAIFVTAQFLGKKKIGFPSFKFK